MNSGTYTVRRLIVPRLLRALLFGQPLQAAETPLARGTRTAHVNAPESPDSEEQFTEINEPHRLTRGYLFFNPDRKRITWSAGILETDKDFVMNVDHDAWQGNDYIEWGKVFDVAPSVVRNLNAAIKVLDLRVSVLPVII